MSVVLIRAGQRRTAPEAARSVAGEPGAEATQLRALRRPCSGRRPSHSARYLGSRASGRPLDDTSGNLILLQGSSR